MSDYAMADISSLLSSAGINNGTSAINTTSKKNNIDLDMTDFLQLMIVQLQSQTIDDTMDTSEMMNQMVQMQMITAITNLNETNIMTYASSLVGKEVTIGIVEDNKLIELPVTVIGTAMSNGQQIIFGKDEDGSVGSYALSQIMAVGRMPAIDEDGNFVPENTNKPGTTTPTQPTQPTEPTQPTQPTQPTDPSEGDGDVNSKPVEPPSTGTEDGGDTSGGTGDTVNSTEPVG